MGVVLRLLYPLLLKVLDLGLLLGPLVVEWFRKKRAEDESAAAYVRAQQKEKLKNLSMVLGKDSEALTAYSRTKLLVARELLKRVHKTQPTTRRTDVLSAGSGVQGDTGEPIPVPSPDRRKPE